MDNVAGAGHFYLAGQISFFFFLIVIEAAVDKDFCSVNRLAPGNLNHRECRRRIPFLRLAIQATPTAKPLAR
jgi:hypothetical protein